MLNVSLSESALCWTVAICIGSLNWLDQSYVKVIFAKSRTEVCADFKTIGRSQVTIVLLSRADSFFSLFFLAC